MLDNTILYFSIAFRNIFYRVLPTSIRKNWKKIKIQIALDFIFCHHLEPEFTATIHVILRRLFLGKNIYCIYLDKK